MNRHVLALILLYTATTLPGCAESPGPTATTERNSAESDQAGDHQQGKTGSDSEPTAAERAKETETLSAPSPKPPASIDEAIAWLSDPLQRDSAMQYLKGQREAALQPLLTLYATTPTLGVDWDRMSQKDAAMKLLSEFGSELVEPPVRELMATIEAQQNAIMLRNAYNAASGFGDGAGPSQRLTEMKVNCTFLLKELRKVSRASRESQTGAEQRAIENGTSLQDTNKATHAFPRSDGVYRFKRRTTLIGLRNTQVYDYIVFTNGGTAYTIKGDYLPPDNYYLEQPSDDPPGAFHMLTIGLAEQPEFILQWIAKPGEKQPAAGSYTVENGVVHFAIKGRAGPSPRAFTVDYEGQKTANGVKMTETSTASGVARVGVVEKVYEFVSVR